MKHPKPSVVDEAVAKAKVRITAREHYTCLNHSRNALSVLGLYRTVCRLFLEHKFSQKSTLFCLQIEVELAVQRYIDLALESSYEKRLLQDVHEVKTSYERLLEKEKEKVQKLVEDKQLLLNSFEERVKQGVDAALESMSSAQEEA